MSPEQSDLIRRIRTALVELGDEGVDWLPAARSAPGARAGTESAAAGTAGATPAGPGSAAAATPDPPAADGARAPGALEQVRSELGECTRCGLSEGRNTIVFGEGSAESAVVFVGEGPGAEEDRTGRPFVGRAGELLTRMIEAVGWRREEVYICNVVKCRPPRNRDPQADEVAACSPFLAAQIAAIRPRVIVTLGKPAIQTLLGRSVAITRERGQWREWNGVPVMPTFHPAYLLRSYTRENRQAVWDDLRAARALADGEAGGGGPDGPGTGS